MSEIMRRFLVHDRFLIMNVLNTTVCIKCSYYNTFGEEFFKFIVGILIWEQHCNVLKRRNLSVS